ncbi:MAG: tRNA-dihydrouridine synthase family protein, partial [bacterium]|nr:tRNA-dihydrouridine synthase family protein [bacterium]
MQKGFWGKLKKPFFALAPMADVTDTAFRALIAEKSEHGELHGGPDVFWTEFVSVDGLLSPGEDALLKDLEFTDREHPIVAQIFGAKPENFREAAKLIATLGFDGIDINMGCPDRSVEKQGAGANLIKNPKLAQEIIRAAMEGAGSLPVSVKTRIGYHQENLEEWLGILLETRPAAITVHARTRKEMSKVAARWEEVARAAALAKGTGTLIIGNGDVKDLADAEAKAKETGADGVMLGRAIFGNPWLFNRKIKYEEISIAEKLKTMV